MSTLCVRCKGMKHLCGRTACPILLKMKGYDRIEDHLVDNELIGESPSVFVGEYNYPNVLIGPLTGKNILLEEESSKWFGTSLNKIIQHRTGLFRGKESIKIDEALDPGKKLGTIQEIAMSEKNIDTDLVFKKKPKFELNFSTSAAPHGPAGDTQKLILESNAKIPRAVDKVVNDELKAVDGMINMYQRGISVDEVQRILSVGLLGIQKKLVPTRWSITATDDSIGKEMLEHIRGFPAVNDYLLFESHYLDNHFQILLMPSKWSFEQIEFYAPGSVWVKSTDDVVYMQDFEGYYNRKKYAFDVAGGYYAGRLGVCEALMRMKRQATALIVREIGAGYYAPVGVWQVRESIRNALQNKPEKYDSLEEVLKVINVSFKVGNQWEKHSELLKLAKSREVFRKYLV